MVSQERRTVIVRTAERPHTQALQAADMTSGQLARRAKIVEAVIALISEVGADAVQMRNVAQRSGVALGTVYRYFSSKEHLLAAALEDWQKRLTRRVTPAGDPGEGTPLPGILDYLERAQRAFHRNPKMTALMLQAMTSNDPVTRTGIDHMARTNSEMLARLLKGVDPQLIPNISFGLDAALSSAVTAVLIKALSLDEALERVEWVARTLVDGAVANTT
ncbi:TetR family transcriptional regulator [Mycobacterium sp. HNNTM2301]|uniref:TetR family transcriptional regulator n=1 Tax=Mycobacterium hainanense TaxID=3289775 RepID=UPI0035A60678